jgi:hypothetical protein
MTISKTPRTDANRLSDDAWPAEAIAQAGRDYVRQQTAMQQPPEPWSEPVERETWFSWRDWEWSDLWAVAFVGTVLAFGAHLAGVWGA